MKQKKTIKFAAIKTQSNVEFSIYIFFNNTHSPLYTKMGCSIYHEVILK